MLYQIFEQILQMSITASVVIAAVLLIRGVMHRMPGRYLYMLWLIVGIRLICPAAVSSPISLFNVVGQRAEIDSMLFVDFQKGTDGTNKISGRMDGNGLSDDVPGNYADGAQTDGNGLSDDVPGNYADGAQTDGNGLSDDMPGSHVDGMQTDGNGLSNDMPGSHVDGMQTDGNGLSGDVPGNYADGVQMDGQQAGSLQGDDMQDKNASGTVLPEGSPSAENIQSGQGNPIIKYGVIVWLAGIAGILLWNLYTTLQMKRKLEKAVRYQENIYECDNIPSPFVMGIVHPRIYIPFRLGEEEREYILEHEKYHIKRRDYLIKVAAFALTCVYWFHPLVWLSYFLMIRDMEMSCDEYVLQNMDSDIRASYSKSLLGFAANRRGVAAGLLSFGETDTRRRVKKVLNYKKHGKWVGVLAIALVIITGAVCLTNARANVEPSASGQKDSQEIKGTEKQERKDADGQDTNGTGADRTGADKKGSNGTGENGIDADGKDTDGKNADGTGTDGKGSDGTGTDGKNAGGKDADGMDVDGKQGMVLAEGIACGYQVRIVYMSDSEAVKKEDLEMGMYEGKFAIQTYKDDAKCAEYALQLADKMYFPVGGFDLVIKDYDGDGAENDFSLGQGQTPDPMLGNFMNYFFFAVGEDGSIMQHTLSTKNGKSLMTIPDDFSKDFPCKDGRITYNALSGNGPKEKTAKIVQASSEETNTFAFEDMNITIKLPENREWIQNPAASADGKTGGIVTYYDGIANTDVTLRFGKRREKDILMPWQKEIAKFSDDSRKADEYWSYFPGNGNKERLIQVRFYPLKNSTTTAVLFWKYKGVEFYLYADFSDLGGKKRGVNANWQVLAKTAAYIAERI